MPHELACSAICPIGAIDSLRSKRGSWLACDAGTSVCQVHRGDAIASKPAPTQGHIRIAI
ncbi:hypothetical protein F7R12_05005 [Pseudomonas tolaasii]|nr:hypothetical protein F7R12_05005 [Pseudomonas tolaasii]